MRHEDLVIAFENCTLDPEVFDHSHHVQLAWVYLRQNPLPEAMVLFRDGLKRFTAHLGVTGKYHETITFAILMMVKERMDTGKEDSFTAFKMQNEDLFSQWRSLMAGYYSQEILNSERARRTFVMPAAALSVVA